MGKYVLQFRGSNPKYSLAVPSFGGKHIQVKMVGNILAYRRLCLNCYNIFINNLMDLEIELFPKVSSKSFFFLSSNSKAIEEQENEER